MEKLNFASEPDLVATQLLGKVICQRLPSGDISRYLITETEAYFGKEDFCYGHKRTKNSDIFYSFGKWCVYAGMIMVSCTKDCNPNNVLIRSLLSLDSFLEIKGPVKIADTLNLPKGFNEDIHITEYNRHKIKSVNELWLEDIYANVTPCEGKPRKGLSEKVRSKDKELPYNFTIKKICFPRWRCID